MWGSKGKEVNLQLFSAITSILPKVCLLQSLTANKGPQGWGENPHTQKEQVNLNLLPSALGKFLMDRFKSQAEGIRTGPTAPTNPAATAKQGKELPTQMYPSLSLSLEGVPVSP